MIVPYIIFFQVNRFGFGILQLLPRIEGYIFPDDVCTSMMCRCFGTTEWCCMVDIWHLHKAENSWGKKWEKMKSFQEKSKKKKNQTRRKIKKPNPQLRVSTWSLWRFWVLWFFWLTFVYVFSTFVEVFVGPQHRAVGSKLNPSFHHSAFLLEANLEVCEPVPGSRGAVCVSISISNEIIWMQSLQLLAGLKRAPTLP